MKVEIYSQGKKLTSTAAKQGVLSGGRVNFLVVDGGEEVLSALLYATKKGSLAGKRYIPVLGTLPSGTFFPDPSQYWSYGDMGDAIAHLLHIAELEEGAYRVGQIWAITNEGVRVVLTLDMDNLTGEGYEDSRKAAFAYEKVRAWLDKLPIKGEAGAWSQLSDAGGGFYPPDDRMVAGQPMKNSL